MPCIPCLDAMGLSDQQRHEMPVELMPKTVGDLLDGGVSDTRCEQGHEEKFAINLPLFEIMFEASSLAILDSYQREAVLGLTTSIECFREFYVCEVLRRLSVDTDTYAEARKGFKLAERQMGAFLACHALVMKKAFDTRPLDRFAKLRNDVAHEGRIPTRDEAIDYGRVALAELHGLLLGLFPSPYEFTSTSDIFRAHMTAASRVAGVLGGRKATSLGMMPTMIGFGAPSTWGQGTFDGRLKVLAKHRQSFYPVGGEQ